MSNPKPHLILHVGTPKTGTTTLQNACYLSRKHLACESILYPTLELHSSPPKHQWLVNYLLNENSSKFEQNIQDVFVEAVNMDAQQIILSAEGIFNHWADFSSSSKLTLRNVREYFDLTVWCVFRDPVPYAMSLYSQLVKNPPSVHSPCYGTFDSPESLIEHAWFINRLDYAGFIQEMEDLFESPVVHATRYEDNDILEQARILLGVNAAILQSVPNANQSLSMLGIDLMRRMNRLGLEKNERQKVVSVIRELDVVLSQTSSPLQASSEMVRKVRAIFKKSERLLIERFGMQWDTVS